MTPLRINLDQEDIPTHWYNIVADMTNPPAPPLGPDGKPVPPEAMGAIFPGPILEQEMTAERWIAIPENRPYRPPPSSSNNPSTAPPQALPPPALAAAIKT